MTYGTLKGYEVQENNEMMNQPITAETLFEGFIEQIEVLVDAVATQVPYTPKTNVSIDSTLVEKSGLYYDGAKEWRRKPTIDENWDNFKDFLSKSSTKFV